MDRASILKRIAIAERHVAEGADRVRRQREIEVEFKRAGRRHAAAEAASLLRTFEDVQAVFVADCDRFKEELAAEGSS